MKAADFNNQPCKSILDDQLPILDAISFDEK